MSDNDYTIEEQGVDAVVGEFDDVEGHGMKEVAVGLGAAAALIGGATTALAAHGGTAPQARVPSVSPTVDASGSIARTADLASSTTGAATAIADRQADDALAAVGGIAADPIGSTDRTTDWAVATTRAARDTALQTATGTVSQTERIAGDAVRSADELANAVKTDALGAVDHTVSTATTTVGSTVKTATTTVGSTVKTATDTVNNLDVSASASRSDGGTDVTVTAAGHSVSGHVG